MVNLVPIFVLLILFVLLFWKFKGKIFNIRRKREDKITCEIVKEGQKPTVIKINRSKKWFNNPNKDDTTKYNINTDRKILSITGTTIIRYRYGIADPVDYSSISKLVLFSKELKNAFESKIIQDFKASVSDQLFKLMDLKITGVLIGEIIIILILFGFIFLFQNFANNVAETMIKVCASLEEGVC